MHYLVVAETRERPANPNNQEHQAECFEEQAENAEQGSPNAIDLWQEWQNVPTAEEEKRENNRAQNNMQIFAHEEQAEFESSVFSVKTADGVSF